jgi:parallel beta-helix repeat protein
MYGIVCSTSKLPGWFELGGTEMRILSVERRRLDSAMVTIIFAASTILAFSVSHLSNGPDTAVLGERIDAGSTVLRTMALTAHDPIYIQGDAGFTNESGVIWGSGTESDPYLIGGWDVNASHEDAISILDTTSFFVVSSCYVHDGGDYHSGIILYNTTNGRVVKNLCLNSYWNLGLFLSNDSIVTDNTCAGGRYGLFLLYCDNALLLGNDCSNNSEAITLWYATNCDILDNNCSSGGAGIKLDISNGNTVVGNECNLTASSGIWAGGSRDNLIEDNNCSSNAQSGISFTGSCNNNTICRNICSTNSEYGVYVNSHSSNNTISENNCSQNTMSGIFIISSACNTITFNQLWMNTQFGVFLRWDTSGNTAVDNIFAYNNGASDVYETSHAQACDNGTGNWWNSTEGSGNYWSDWTEPDEDMNGIVDEPYSIAGSTGAKDYYPLTTEPPMPIPEMGMIPLVVMIFIAAIFMMKAVRRREW